MATVHKWEKYTVASQFVDNGYENVVSCNYYSPPTVKLYSGTTPDSTTSTVLFDEIPYGSYFIFNSTTYRATSTAGRSGKYYNILAIPVAVAEGKGSLIETVESENSAAYPTDGAQDGYWYVYTGSEEIEVCAVYATIDGVQKKLTSIPAMIDGVQREFTSLFATVGGVAREIFHVSLVIEFVITHLSTTGDGAKQSTTYYAEKGMTFGEWLESEYNTDGFFYNSSLGFICNSSNNAGLFYYPTYDGIPLDEVIESGSEYYLYN